MNSQDTPPAPRIPVHSSETCSEIKAARTARDLMSDPKYDVPALEAGTLASAEPTDVLRSCSGTLPPGVIIHDATDATRNAPKSLDDARDTILVGVGSPKLFKKRRLTSSDSLCNIQPNQKDEVAATSLASDIPHAVRGGRFQIFPARGMTDDRNCSLDNRTAWNPPSWSTSNLPPINIVGLLDKPRDNAYEEAPSAGGMARQNLLTERRASVPLLQELTYTARDEDHSPGQLYASVPTTGTHFCGQIQESLAPQRSEELAQQVEVDMSSRASSPLSSCPPSEQLDL